MTQLKVAQSGEQEQEFRRFLSHVFRQDSTGIATDGVLAGLGVSQTATASASVVVGKGCGVVQDSLLNGAQPLVLDTDLTLDVLTANPMGGVPRNDIVVFDAATLTGGTGGVRVIVGTPNASPTDPTVPATAIPLARLRHAASATTVPTSKIDTLKVQTSLNLTPAVKLPAPVRAYTITSATDVGAVSSYSTYSASDTPFTTPAPVLALVTLRCELTGTSATWVRAMLDWSGATTSDSQTLLGGFSGVLRNGNPSAVSQALTFSMTLPAGTTNFRIKAIKGAAVTPHPTISYGGVEIVPLGWASDWT